MDNFLQEIKNNQLTKFWIKVKAGARQNSLDEICIIEDKKYLCLSVTAIRDKGKANKMIIEYLVQMLLIPKQKIQIKTGTSASIKQIIILP
jgi:uncharacterized protein YggU (UPF0235/DUF167 family)